jgi:hypothetical protein
MSPTNTAAERFRKARQLIQKARDLPVPADGGKYNLSYIAQVKDYLRQARDLVKLLPLTPSATAEVKAEVQQVLAEAAQADKEILR